jgi:hypothetical protein
MGKVLPCEEQFRKSFSLFGQKFSKGPAGISADEAVFFGSLDLCKENRLDQTRLSVARESTIFNLKSLISQNGLP